MVAERLCTAGGLRVLVCGGRRYRDWRRVREVLRTIHDAMPIEMIIHGCAAGADALAERWAHLAGVPQAGFAAEWELHGKAAGPLRNQRMLDEGKPDLVVAFPGGAGTADLVRRAEAAGIEIRRVAGHA
jgi:hypothetical protein